MLRKLDLTVGRAEDTECDQTSLQDLISGKEGTSSEQGDPR